MLRYTAMGIGALLVSLLTWGGTGGWAFLAAATYCFFRAARVLYNVP
jgi:hypothetical protein